ncbi:MAG: hypothetical protein KBT34_14080 [Prevotella sp.]|nr:hypothetical protein [Candidatus Prevotella equi]
MKKLLLFFIVAMVVMACSEGDKPTPKPYNNLTDSIGTVTQQPAWVATNVELLNPSVAQIVVVTQSELPVPVKEEDLIGAFVGGECRAVAKPVVEPNGKIAFTLTILGKDDADDDGKDVELRYYSKNNSRIYIAQPFAFIAGERLGDLNNSGYKVVLR